jgi:hypothetical protein
MYDVILYSNAVQPRYLNFLTFMNKNLKENYEEDSRQYLKHNWQKAYKMFFKCPWEKQGEKF